MAVPISNLTATWANASNTYTGIGLNVTASAYSTDSSLLRLKVNNDLKFAVAANGDVMANGNYRISTVARSIAMTLIFGR